MPYFRSEWKEFRRRNANGAMGTHYTIEIYNLDSPISRRTKNKMVAYAEVHKLQGSEGSGYSFDTVVDFHNQSPINIGNGYAHDLRSAKKQAYAILTKDLFEPVPEFWC